MTEAEMDGLTADQQEIIRKHETHLNVLLACKMHLDEAQEVADVFHVEGLIERSLADDVMGDYGDASMSMHRHMLMTYKRLYDYFTEIGVDLTDE